jgi:S-adenosylmethionine hydrolase
VDRVTTGGPAPRVALVTDFGSADPYVAELKLAVARCVPSARVLDVTHEVPAFDRVAAAMAVDRALRELPDRKSTRLNSSHNPASRMPSSA